MTRHCPFCAAPLYGGPVQYGCTGCRKNVFAADLHTEVHTTLTTRAALEVQ